MVDPSSHLSAPAAQALFGLVQFAAKLKSVPRTGWLDRGLDAHRVESVADHSFGVALLAWVCALQRQAEGTPIDPERVLQLAIIHDLAEAKTGDSTPYDPAAIPGEHDPAARRAFLETRHSRDSGRRAAKRAHEDAVMRALLAALPSAMRSTLEEIWNELHLGESPEARFVKQVDHLETFLQSRFYLDTDPALPVASFHQEVLETIDDPLLAAIRDAALSSVSPDETK
ncbi:MAG: domain containing 2 [Thermomicrobiales bacterium]|nr:domain containing 2 [Thermomicrobiales bacterium]MDF3017473.1 domain containing 2 [Thermomicrobiales bacterium]